MRLLSLLLLVLSVLCLANLSLAETEINPGVELRNQAVKADEEAIKSLEEARGSASKFEFQTEVNKLLGIIINSLYTNKDIFLRELISNASDALDKIRFLALTDSNALKSTPELEIRIRADKEHKELIIRDTGIGMTKEDLVNNLGTIARSGTKNFIEKVKEGSDLNMIGQFGVGFYSAFLVADRVTVITKNNDDDKQYIWESNADNTFSISEDPRGNTLGRGSEIRLFLKDDAQSYLDDAVLKDLIIKYSEFVHFPIQLYKESEVEKEVPVEEEEVVEEAKPEEEEETKEEEESDAEKVDVEEEEKEEKEEKPKTKKVKELVGEFSVVNANKPIWTRPSKEVTTEEYNKFYKTISKEYDEPLTHIHFTAEGQDVVFKSILYVPGHAPSNLFETINQPKSTNIKLYVRKVFITDEFTDLMPRYLNFVRGVVDSDDLPLNVSREILQQSKLLRIIRKTLIRKSLEMLKNAAQAEEEAEAKEKEKEKTENREDEETEETKPKVDYTKIWKEFGKNIRLGLLEDSANQSRLSKLLRYHTSKSGDKLVSFEKYVSNMKEGQKDIYFLSGDNLETVKNSPFLEALEKRGFEVVFMIDPIDEYVTNYLTEFDGKKLVNIAKEGLKFGDEEEKKNEAEFEDLTKYMKKVLGSKVESVKVSSRLTSTPCVLVSGQYGLTANMEKILKAQTMSVSDYGKATKVMEINPAHPIIKEINRRVRDNDDDLVAKDATELMYDTALMTGGFTVDDVPGFSNRIFAALKSSLNVEESAVEEDSTTAEATRTTTTTTTTDSDTESATTKPADEEEVRDEL